MTQSPDKVLKLLQDNKYAPVYFLHGDESYYLDLIADYIETHALSPGEKGFNQLVLYGKDTDMATILGQARRYPMMAARQVLIVKELTQMGDWNKNDSNRLLENYLEHPLSSTVLVLVHKHKTLSKNTKLYKALEKGAVVVESKRLYENQTADWIQHYLKQRNYSISEKANELMLEAIGPELSRLSGELDKLMLNLSPGSSITPDLVEKYIGISKDFNVFELQKALAYKKGDKCWQILHYWQANPKRQPLIPTLASLFNFYTKILVAYQQTDRSDQNLARVLKVHPYFLADYKQAMRNYSVSQLIEVIHYLRTADLQSKGIVASSSDESEILREFVFKVIAG
ncbi:MAG: DNA polymerase III subunit delta [Bacteroidia bacterium]|nr:DNA polymerase III subunit delta [Bacteroidia bacterium]